MAIASLVCPNCKALAKRLYALVDEVERLSAELRKRPTAPALDIPDDMRDADRAYRDDLAHGRDE